MGAPRSARAITSTRSSYDRGGAVIRVVLVDDSAVVRRLFKKAMAFASDVQFIHQVIRGKFGVTRIV